MKTLRMTLVASALTLAAATPLQAQMVSIMQYGPSLRLVEVETFEPTTVVVEPVNQEGMAEARTETLTSDDNIATVGVVVSPDTQFIEVDLGTQGIFTLQP